MPGLRIIGGSARGRKLQMVPGSSTRPISDRAKESLFNILGADIESAEVLDLFAGTGSVGIEALSRGAARAVFIERSKNAAKVLHENLASLGIEGRALVVPRSVISSISAHKADIVFLDPPYERESEYDPALGLLSADPPRLVVVQHSVRFTLAETYGVLKRTRRLKQGDNALSFYALA